MNTTHDHSLSFPWPEPLGMQGPGIRVVAADPIWRGGVWLAVERYRGATTRRLPFVPFESIEQLKRATCDSRLVDVLEIGRDQLSETANWIADCAASRNLATLLCLKTLREPPDRDAASQLLREAGAKVVIGLPRELGLLTELVVDVCTRWGDNADPLSDLPLPCWGPAWQRLG